MLKGDSKNRTAEGNVQSKGKRSVTLSSSVNKGVHRLPSGAHNQSELLENESLQFKANDGSGERGSQDRSGKQEGRGPQKRRQWNKGFGTSEKKRRGVGNGVQGAAAATENDREGELKKRERKRPQTRRKRPESVLVDNNNNTLLENNDASLGVGDEQDMIKQSQESSQSSGVVERSAAGSDTKYVMQAQNDVLSAGEKGETRGDSLMKDLKPQERRRHRRKTKKREVVEDTNSNVLPDKDGTRKSVVTHTLALNDGRTGNNDETQDLPKEKGQRRPEKRREETENVVVHSGGNTMKRNGLQDSATERNGERQNQAFKSKRRRPPKMGGTASGRSEETTPQKGPQNGATGTESEVVDGKEALKKERRQTKKKDNRSYSEGGVSETPLPINIPKDTAAKGIGKQSGVKKGKEKRPEFKRRGESKKVGKQGNDNDNAGFLKYNEPSESKGKGGTRLQVEGPYESRCTYVNDTNASSQKDAQFGATGKDTRGNKAQTEQREIQTGAKRKEKQTIHQDCLSIKAMERLLEKSSEEIVHDLTSEHLPLLDKRQQMKDDAAIALIKLFVKACRCESHADLEKMLSTLQSSWFLTRRLGALLNQLVWKKWEDQQIQVQKLGTVGDILTLLTNVLSRFPNSSSNSLLAKLHKSTMTSVRSGKPLNKSVVVILQDLMKLRKKLEISGGGKHARSRPPSAEVDPNGRPPENFRELSVIPTTLDIVAVGNHDQGPFLRKNKVKGGYLDVEHYLDVQFRLLREDFLRPLRDGIQLLMTMPGNGRDDRLQDVRVYNNVRILHPVCTSSGVRYKVRFDVSEFRRVQWENSKRLTFGSLLCLSKNNFNSFVFASVAERKLHDVIRGFIEVRFLSTPSEDRPRPGDVCTMVESIAFFEAYRPVLEGLQMLSPRDFPFKRYIVDVNCDEDVHPPAYLVKSGDQPVVLDFSAIIPGKATKASPGRLSPTGLKKKNIHLITEAAGPNVPVLDLTSWPSANDLKLDDSQLKALQLALTKEFAVIQGPPGTGKTFIGLKIAKVLLHNRNTWSPNQKGGPILVVCYTNHALDQFLEGILDFHPEGIIRVGGRSQSEKIQECSLSKRKQKMIKDNLMSRSHRQAFGEIKREMNVLSDVIEYHVQLLEELQSRVFREDELRDHASNMTSKQYDSLVKRSVCITEKRRESVIPQWLGLPVLPRDPYQDGFAKPRAMFPFNAECKGLEYFTQEEPAILSKDVRSAPGIDGNPEGSLELQGTSASFIEIPNHSDGLLDVKRSITLLAFIYPMGGSGPILSYHVDGLGVQLGYNRRDEEIGTLTASFIQRDLVQTAAPFGAPVLRNNEWNFVGASYDHNSGIARLWHNGKEVKANFLFEGLELATQFSIRIGGLEGDCEETFSGRISHLHIYNEALTAENIRAVGGISQPFSPGSYSEKDTAVENDERIHESSGKETRNEEEKEGNDQKWNSRGFTFEADALEDQRILETDQVIRFGPRRSDETTSDLPPSGAEARVQSGGFQYQDPRRIRRKIKNIIRKELKKDDMMTSEEATQVEDVWKMSDMGDRWRLYRRWVYDARESCYRTIFQLEEMFDDKVAELQELRKQEDLEILKKADVVGMTTTGAARNRSLLQDLQPVITIVEEAAEVFEAHTVTSLTPGCQHLILIGDHQQLRPSPTVYDLEIGYYLHVSLFERMVTNGLRFERLCLQHRMRPEIAKMLDHIYVSPKLQNHDSVLKFENVKGVERNLFFVDHNEREDNVVDGKSKSNAHEAKFLTALCRYFIQQGYQREQITVLTAYVGQLLNLKREMSKEKDFFEGVRVTAVDNFQGEENDIILLSLVRSQRIGFLKIANRVCVALSRARKGFYIIGNAALLSKENPDLWGKIIRDMSKEGNLGSHLTLVCQNHPQNVVEALSAEDFENAPKGGCREPCKYSMPDCEHNCQSFCHPIDIEHKEEFVCRMPCARRCDRGHLCRKICSQDCDPCMKTVPKIIPGCGHEQEVPCSIDPSEFRCKQLVQKQASPCGHMNCVECSTEIADIVCRMPCARTCDREHNCSKTCSEDCGPCMVKVPKLIPGCNHEQEVPCCMDPSEFKCKQNVRKQASPCGHVNDAECSLAATAIECLETCGVLECGHPCEGNCCKCSQGRLHLPCPFPCQRTLFCGHTCKAACVRPCPPCSESCSICRQSCSRPCRGIENDDPQCPHHKCTERCADPCGRQRCDNPCQEQLSCGHSCIGICGEVCPKLCRVCNEGAAEFNESERETMFVELVDCGHVFDVKTMDQWMAVPDDKGDENEIQLKHCPKCNTPIFHSRRYGKILADFNAVKRRILLSDVASEVQIQEIRNELRNLQSIEMKAHVREIKRSLTTNHVTFQLVSKHQTQVVFLKFLEHLITKYNSTVKLSQELHDRIQFLTKRIIRKRDCFSKQEIKQFTAEVLRTNLLVLLESLEFRAITLSPENDSILNVIKSALASGKTIGNQQMKVFMADIEKIKQRHGLFEEVEASISESEMKNGAVTKTLAEGPWYKCSKGHVYSACQRIEEEGTVKCPDCIAAGKPTPDLQTEDVVNDKPPHKKTMVAKPVFTSGDARQTRPRPVSKNFVSKKFRK